VALANTLRIKKYLNPYPEKLNFIIFNPVKVKFMLKYILLLVLTINYTGVLAQDNSGKPG
jgi:hypothetical protein